jgi:AcrR family transcriptional regulator
VSKKKRKYEQTARAKSQERTREALIEAAANEFFSGGWADTSLNRLAKRAGVTKQTLLRHFGSKHGLLMHALLRGAVQIRAQRWSAPQGDIPGAVANVLDHYEAWGERSLMIGSWQSGSGLLAGISQAARHVHYEWVEYAFAPWLERAEGEERRRRRVALIVLCDVQTWWLLSHDLKLDRGEVAATLTTAIERLLGAQPR